MLLSHTTEFIRQLPKVAVLVNLSSVDFSGGKAKYIIPHHCIFLSVVLV